MNTNIPTTETQLVAFAKRMSAWLEREAKRADKMAADTRFVTLRAASIADAKNYRAMLADAKMALAESESTNA